MHRHMCPPPPHPQFGIGICTTQHTTYNVNSGGGGWRGQGNPDNPPLNTPPFHFAVWGLGLPCLLCRTNGQGGYTSPFCRCLFLFLLLHIIYHCYRLTSRFPCNSLQVTRLTFGAGAASPSHGKHSGLGWSLGGGGGGQNIKEISQIIHPCLLQPSTLHVMVQRNFYPPPFLLQALMVQI